MESKSRSSVSAFTKAYYLLAVLALPVSFPASVNAQAPPPVPSTFQDLYTELDNYLINFNTTLGTPAPYPYLLCGNLLAANGNSGPGLINGMPDVQLQINALKAMGAQAIMIEIGFPMLYEPFLTSQGQSYSAYVSFYQNVALAVRQAGMKLVIENDTLLVNDVQAGWDAAPFYATLNWTQYMQARGQTALTIAQTLQPDYMMVLAQPQTEYDDSGQAEANTPSGSAALLSQILSTVQPAIPNLPLGAGVGTSQENALSFIQQYVTLPVNFIDMHIYPVNDNYLPIALQIISTAQAAGLPVSMTECWLWKVRDSEINVLSIDQIRGRDPFSFWSPLDVYMIQTMENLANYSQMIFMNPFGEYYYYAYQTYDDSTMNLTPDQIISQESALAQAAVQQASFTPTALGYYNSVVNPPDTTPPTAPTGLTGVSANPNQTSISWGPGTDNVGVAGYYIWRSDPVNGNSIVTTTASLNYHDSGLTEATTYTYSIQSFDLAGNVSTVSTPFVIQTTNATPPTIPANVSAQAVSCSKATVTWSPSTDKIRVTQYLVFYGLSPGGMSQVGNTVGTTYSNSNLSAGTTYYFAIQAVDNDQNVSNMSSLATVTTPALPVAPNSVLATPNSTTMVTVTWAASTGGLPIAHYLVYRGTSPSSLSQVATATKTSYTDTSVVGSTTYYYAIQAADTGKPPAQSGLSAPISVTTISPPSVPAGLTATATSETKVVLAWSAAVSGGLPIGNYKVYKGTSPDNLTQLAVTPNTSYTDTKDTASTTYYYAVQSTDTGKPPDASAISAPVSVTTFGPPGVPGTLVATATSSTKVSLTWTASASGGLPISNYKVYRGTTSTGLTQVATTTNTSYNNSLSQCGDTVLLRSRGDRYKPGCLSAVQSGLRNHDATTDNAQQRGGPRGLDYGNRRELVAIHRQLADFALLRVSRQHTIPNEPGWHYDQDFVY